MKMLMPMGVVCESVDELIFRAKNGGQTEFAEVAEIYEPLISSMVARFSSGQQKIALEEEDLRQEALIALFVAVMSYDSESPVSFGLYAKVCIRNRLISALRKVKHDIIADDLFLSENSEELVSADPESEYIDKESYGMMRRAVDATLTEYERAVLKLYLRDMSYKEISETLGKTEKSVGNALCRIKAKIKDRF